MKHAPNYYEYWSDPKHDMEHQYAQYMAKHGPLVMRCSFSYTTAKLNDGNVYVLDRSFETRNPLTLPIGME